ncbi:MAG: hypothetical protein ACTS73_00195 [Arsenophonus sp. NEOnobi-MAG3]
MLKCRLVMIGPGVMRPSACNSYLSQLTIQTANGHLKIKVSKIRNRSRNEICFNTSLLSHYLKCEKMSKSYYHGCIFELSN